MDLYTSTIIYHHLNAIQDLLKVMMDNNSCMLRHLDNMENTLSKMSPDALEHSAVVVSLHDKCKSERVATPLVIAESEFDLDLDKGLSIPIDNSEEENSGSYACKVFAEISDREIDMGVINFMRNNFVNPETQVFDETFQPVSVVKYAYRHLVLFDNQLSLSFMFSSSRHDQPIDSDTIDYFSEFGLAKLILSLNRFPREQFELYFSFDPGSSFLTAYLGTPQNYIFWDVLGALFFVCFGPKKRLQLLLFCCTSFSVNLLNNAPNEDVQFAILLMELPTISFISRKLDKLLFHCVKKDLPTFLMVSSSRHSLSTISSFLIKVLVQFHLLHYEMIPATTFQLLLSRICDSIWNVKAGTRKKECNISHSWDYTLLPAEQLIWNSIAGIALVCEPLHLVHYFLMIRVLTQNILNKARCFSTAMCFNVLDYGGSNHSNVSRITLDIHRVLKLHHFPYASGATRYVVILGGTIVIICVWDPGINSKTLNLNGYTEAWKTYLLLESTCKFCLCAYSNRTKSVGSWPARAHGFLHFAIWFRNCICSFSIFHQLL